jgi:DNA polymerase-3 subunit epsilon
MPIATLADRIRMHCGVATPRDGVRRPSTPMGSLMQCPRFIAIDTETTGLDPEHDRIIEIAWATYEGGVITSTHESLVFPARPLPPVVARLTGITPGLLARAPRFSAVVEDLLAAMAGAEMLVAYNAAFDRAFLTRELARLGHEMPDIPFVDPLQIVRAIDDDVSHTLAAVATRYGIATTSDHRALPDACAAGEILLRLLPRIDAFDVDSILSAQRSLKDKKRQRRANVRVAL